MNSKEIHEAINGITELVRNATGVEQVASIISSFQSGMIAEIAAQLADAQVSLRDRMAIAAMQGDWARENGFWSSPDGYANVRTANVDIAAKYYYAMADAMLKVREES